MAEISLSTPALVFPALSVLMLAYTNRFIAVSRRARTLHKEYKANPNKSILQQISFLRKRLRIIKNTQTLAISGFLINMISIFIILIGGASIAIFTFAFGLLCMTASLIMSLIEIHMSINAMEIELSSDYENTNVDEE